MINVEEAKKIVENEPNIEKSCVILINNINNQFVFAYWSKSDGIQNNFACICSVHKENGQIGRSDVPFVTGAKAKEFYDMAINLINANPLVAS